MTHAPTPHASTSLLQSEKPDHAYVRCHEDGWLPGVVAQGESEGVMAAAKERILVVDDDQVALANYRRLLRPLGDVDAVTSATAALDAVSQQGRRYAVVLTEAILPDMKGLDLLKEILRVSPKIERVVVTSALDQKTVIDALNEIGVARFLTKPSTSEALVAAVREGLNRHLRHRRENRLKLQAYDGIIQLLTGYFDLSEPEITGMSGVMRERARTIAQAVKLPPSIELDLAVLLMRLGIATIPKHVRDKLHAHEKLPPEEIELIDRIPEMAAHILDHNPRLAGVAEIIRHEEKSSPNPRADVTGKDRVPLAARILRAVVDLQILENTGLTTSAALIRMRQDLTRYDRDVIKAMEHLYADPEAIDRAETEELMVEALMTGMTLATDALSDEGVPLVSKGTVLTEGLIERLRSFAELGEIVEPLYVRRAVHEQA